MKTLVQQKSINFGGLEAAFGNGLNNNALIYRDKSLILIDLSHANFKAYAKAGLFNGYEEINVVVTHTHGDHVSGLGCSGLFSFFNVAPSFINKMNVYAPAAIAKDVQDLLRIMGVTAKHHQFFAIEDSIEIAGVTFSPIEVEHVEELQCFAYEINLDGKNIYYSGDSNMIPSEVLEKINNGSYDEIYQDTCVDEYPGNVHLSLSLLESLIQDRSIREKVFCMHLDNNFPVDKAKQLGFNIVSTII